MCFVKLAADGYGEVCLPVDKIVSVTTPPGATHTPSVTVTVLGGASFTRTGTTGQTPYEDFLTALERLGVSVGG